MLVNSVILLSIFVLVFSLFLPPLFNYFIISKERNFPKNYLVEENNGQIFIFPMAEQNYPIRNWTVDDLNLNATSAILYHLESEKILFEKNVKKKLPIASLTKLLSAILVIENMDLGDTVEIKSSAIEKSKKFDGGSDLYVGEKIKALDLLKIMLIKSSNDAAYAFEDHLLDNYKINLVGKMNEKAKELGMLDTKFTEPAGLDDQNSFSTVEDLLNLVKYSLKYELIFDILRTPKTEVVSIDGRLRHKVLNTNQLLGVLLNIIGGKTGFTQRAGGSMILVAKASYGNGHLIAIVLGSNDRFGDTKKLIEWANKAYIWK